jgi:hypothetical protein
VPYELDNGGMVFDILYLALPDNAQQARQNWRCLVAMNETSAKKYEKMKALTYWDSFRELEDMQHRLSSVLGRQTHRRPDGDKESITVACGRYY